MVIRPDGPIGLALPCIGRERDSELDSRPRRRPVRSVEATYWGSFGHCCSRALLLPKGTPLYMPASTGHSRRLDR